MSVAIRCGGYIADNNGVYGRDGDAIRIMHGGEMITATLRWNATFRAFDYEYKTTGTVLTQDPLEDSKFWFEE